jgi:sodium-independent sulfate anion transporter 11
MLLTQPPQDRPWNDPGPRRGKPVIVDDTRPILRAIVLDFSSVHTTDVTSVQGLIDIRNQLERYTAPEVVEWHFANLTNRWTKRALAAAGFGYASASKGGGWKSIVSIADIYDAGDAPSAKASLGDIENVDSIGSNEANPKNAGNVKVTNAGGKAALYGLNRPFFHVDVETAVRAAVLSAEAKDLRSPTGKESPDLKEVE